MQFIAASYWAYVARQIQSKVKIRLCVKCRLIGVLLKENIHRKINNTPTNHTTISDVISSCVRSRTGKFFLQVSNDYIYRCSSLDW